MLLNLLIGLPVMILCLAMQSIFVIVCLRRYVSLRQAGRERGTRFLDFYMLSMVMIVMLFGNLVQVGIWAALFILLREFNDFATALYFSGVNFATLGYGDIVMSERWRLLGPLEAAQGILMFGVSTSAMTAAVMDLIKSNRTRILKIDE